MAKLTKSSSRSCADPPEKPPSQGDGAENLEKTSSLPAPPEANEDGDEDTIVYWLDKEDRILDVNASWDRFASENGGEMITADDVCGRPLGSFIAGDATQLWIGALMKMTRSRRSPIETKYRCDSPDMRRFMTMRILPLSRTELKVEHRLVLTEPLSRTVSFATTTGAPGALKIRCSMCCRVKIQGRWVQPDSDGVANNLGEAEPLKVIYGVCHACRTNVGLRSHS